MSVKMSIGPLYDAGFSAGYEVQMRRVDALEEEVELKSKIMGIK